MTRSLDAAARDAKIAALKQLIVAHAHDSEEQLEEAVDELLWSEHDRRQELQVGDLQDLARTHPK